MPRNLLYKMLFVLLLTLGCTWYLTPTYYYFKLAPEVRNDPKELAKVLPKWAPNEKYKINLGLDLQGGIHLVLGVDVETALERKVTRRADQIRAHLKEKGIAFTEVRDLANEPRVAVRVPEDRREEANKAIVARYPDMRVVATTSDGTIFGLSGGVASSGAVRASDLKKVLTEKGFPEAEVQPLKREPRVEIVAATPEQAAAAEKEVLDFFADMHRVADIHNGFQVAFADQYLSKIRGDAVDQAMKTIRNRVDKWGVSEISIAKRGADSIMVQLPGYKDPEKAKELLGTTAQLEFKMVDDESSFFRDLAPLPEGVSHVGNVLEAKDRALLAQAVEGKVPAQRSLGIECIPSKTQPNTCESYRSYLLFSKAELTGDDVSEARAVVGSGGLGAGGTPEVALTFSSGAAKTFEELTGANVGKRMAIVLDGTVTSAPVIQNRIPGGNCRITLGGLKPYNELLQEATDLALVLNAGALPAPVTIQEERTVGAELGPDLIRRGFISMLVGTALVILFMALYYRASGLTADLALGLNFLLILAALAMFGGTLTMPGMAGVVLTLGMAVDANVIINERIREELRGGKTARAAVELGYSRAFWTIFDAHVTTLIAGFVLLQYGTGPVRGFAVTLIIGIIASLFTSIFVTRVIMDAVVVRKDAARLSV